MCDAADDDAWEPHVSEAGTCVECDELRVCPDCGGEVHFVDFWCSECDPYGSFEYTDYVCRDCGHTMQP